MFWYPLKGIQAELYDTDDIAATLSSLEISKISWRHSQFLCDAPARGGKLLEVGCSTGEFLKTAKDHGYSVSGFDYNRSAVEFARSHFGLSDVYSCSLEEFIKHSPNVKYDVIVFFEVLEHLEDVPGFMDLIIKLLVPAGFMALSVPNRDKWRFQSEKYFREKWDLPPNHLTRWDMPALNQLFSRHDFSVLTIKCEKFKLIDHVWSNFISGILGINRIAVKISRNSIGQIDGSPVISRKFSLRKSITRWGARFYLGLFYFCLGVLSLPLRVSLIKGGNSIYLLAQLNNQIKKEID